MNGTYLARGFNLKQDSHFAWNQSLEAAFQHSKQVIVELVRDGITAYEKDHIPCLTSDWNKEGMSFLLLQKYCSCTTHKAPVCCLPNQLGLWKTPTASLQRGKTPP